MSKLEINEKVFANFDNASRAHYDGQGFDNLANSSPLEALSMLDFYISQVSKTAILAVNKDNTILASVALDGEEATRSAAQSLTPGRLSNNTLERQIWNDDVIVSVVKQGLIGRITGRKKEVKSIRILLSHIPVND